MIFTSQQQPNEKTWFLTPPPLTMLGVENLIPQTGHFRNNKMVVTIMIRPQKNNMNEWQLEGCFFAC